MNRLKALLAQAERSNMVKQTIAVATIQINMSKISIIAISGNFIERETEIFETFRYKDLKKDKVYSSLHELENYLEWEYIELAKREIAVRGLFSNNQWTVISDPERVDATDIQRLEILSQKLGTEVFSFIGHKGSGIVEFIKIDKVKKRRFLSITGHIEEDFGSPIPEEQEFSIDKNVSVDDLVSLARKMGIPIQEGGSAVGSYIVKELGYNEELKNELKSLRSLEVPNQPKPWWKFW